MSPEETRSVSGAAQHNRSHYVISVGICCQRWQELVRSYPEMRPGKLYLFFHSAYGLQDRSPIGIVVQIAASAVGPSNNEYQLWASKVGTTPILGA